MKERGTIILNIKNQRMLKGIRQVDMAKRLHMSQSAYAKIEMGYTKIDIGRIQDLCAIFEISITSLLDPKESQESNTSNGTMAAVAHQLKTLYEQRIESLERENHFLRNHVMKKGR